MITVTIGDTVKCSKSDTRTMRVTGLRIPHHLTFKEGAGEAELGDPVEGEILVEVSDSNRTFRFQCLVGEEPKLGDEVTLSTTYEWELRQS
jgi:hypothetical protein